ncbi:MAG: GMC family oxidoreductase [Nitrococcus sp.]|nr:GMC family oxidoreductase [Nitrococcus sp.]
MFFDALQVPQDSLLQCDVCIIGAGAAGIAIARELIETRHKVILLESGGFEMDAEVQYLNAGEIVGLRYMPLHTGRSRYFGGGTNCWGGWCRPFDATDFEKRDWVPHSGWPFGRSTLDPYYERAHKLCSIRANDYDPKAAAGLGLQPLPIEDPRVITQVCRISDEPRFGRTYRDEMRAATNIDTYLNANVVEIETVDSAREITGLKVATLGGKHFRVAAKAYVLAAGGIENPRLLLASNRVQKAGLGNDFDLVGRFFMEHPCLHAGEIVLNDRATTTNLYDPHYTFFNSPIGAHLALSGDAQRVERVLNFRTWIVTFYRGEESRGGESLKNLYRAIRKRSLPDHFMDCSGSFWIKNFGNIALDFPNTTAVVLGRLFRPKWLVKKLMFTNQTEPAPNPNSRVTLTGEKDKVGLNRVRLDWRLTQLEKYSIRRAQEIIHEALEKSGVGRVENQMSSEADAIWPEDLGWEWHQMGTTRMQDDPKRGVVDSDCKVHGISNLFIAGSSVFPTGGNSPPTLTILALALRLADHIKATLQ